MEFFDKQKLKRERERRRLSFGEFAKLLAVHERKASKALIWAWEAGRSKPNSRYLIAISKVFGVNPDFFFKVKKKA